jgi:hypothetical protein
MDPRLVAAFGAADGSSGFEGDFAELEQALCVRLPADYRSFLRYANGFEGFIGPTAYVMLWRAEELVRLNDAYQVTAYAPGLLLFGSDGSGSAFGFDMRERSTPVVDVPFVGMDWTLARVVGAGFFEFLEYLSAQR